MSLKLPEMPSSVNGCSASEAVTTPSYFPWFMDHVKTSLIKKSFSPLYFTVGLVEEVAELSEALNSPSRNEENIRSEVGDVCWYAYGLCQSLEDVTPVPSDGDDDTDLLGAVGRLCGSIKKWSRGDQDWAVFRPRVQGHVSQLLAVVTRVSPVTLDTAMRSNIQKIRSRRERGVVRGDGSNR